MKGIEGPNTGPVKGVRAATGTLEDETVSCVMMEGEEATTGTEVTTGYVVDGAITGAVIKEGVVVTTEAEVGEGKEEEVVAVAAAFCATLVAWYRAARWRFFSL